MSANAEQEILDRARIMLETSRAMRTYTTTQKEFVGRRDTPGGPEPFISAPIRVDDKSCLICHGVAARAPPKLVKLYGINNGFDWRLNDVVDAQIMGVPAPVAQNRVLAAQNTIMVWLAGLFAALWALINGLVYVFYERSEFTSSAAR